MIARGPALFAYLRVSTDTQFESTWGLKAQNDQLDDYRAWHPLLKEVYWSDELSLYYDPCGVSTKVPFLNRKAAQTLCARLIPGDHLMISSLDRAFGSLKDALIVLDWMLEHGVTLHLVRERQVIAEDDPMGMLLFKMLALASDIERTFIRMRTKAAHKAMKDRGVVIGGAAKDILWTTSHKGTKRKPNFHNRRVLAHAMYLHEQGMGAQAIFRQLNKERLFRSDKKRFNIDHLKPEYFAKCRELGMVPEKFPDALRDRLPKRSK
jgi:DNA invertase Pin-like site-specific DNA recombinase